RPTDDREYVGPVITSEPDPARLGGPPPVRRPPRRAGPWQRYPPSPTGATTLGHHSGVFAGRDRPPFRPRAATARRLLRPHCRAAAGDARPGRRVGKHVAARRGRGDDTARRGGADAG